MSGPLRVLVLGPQSRARLPRSAGIEFHHCIDLADLMGRAGAGAADAALLSPQAAGVDALLVARLRERGCRPIGWASSSAEVVLAQRSGLDQCVADPVDPAALRASVDTPRRGVAAEHGGSGIVVAVWGPPGSPGRSTVAALLAVGARRAGRSVLVVDADLAGPRWNLLSEPGKVRNGLVTATRRAATGVVDLSDLTVQIGDQIDLLPGLAEPGRWLDVAPGAAGSVLRSAAALAETVVVDLPGDIRPAHPAYDLGWAHDAAAFPRAVLAEADLVVPVLSADPLGVHRFATWWPVLREQAAPASLVANAVGHPSAGRRPVAQLAQVLAALGIDPIVAQVPWDTRAAAALLQPGWDRARRWRATPERVWQAVAEERSLAA